MNVKSFSDLADVLIQPDEGEEPNLKRTSTIDEGEYGDDFEEVDYEEEFEDADKSGGERKEASASRFSIEARGSEDDVLLNSRSFSRIEVRRSVESNDGAAEIIQRNLENISVSGSDDGDDDIEAVKDMPTPAKPDEFDTRSSRPEVIEISNDVPRRAIAPPVQAAVKVSPGKSAAAKKTFKLTSSEEKFLADRRVQQAPGVKAPTKAFMSMNSKIQVASHWEVPGVSIYEGNKTQSTATGSKAPNTEEDREYTSKSDREKIILTVLDLLQTASKKAQTQQDVQVAMKGHAIRIPSVRTGVSKKQALKATGKMYMGNVPDYDPDFDTALQFMRSNEWNAEEDPAGEAGATRGSDEMKESSDGRPYYGSSGSGSGSGAGERAASNNKTFPERKPATVGGPRKMNASAPVPIESPKDQFHPMYGKARGYTPSSPATSEQQPQNGPPNFEADKDLRAVNSSVENYATWLKPNYLKRAHVLSAVPAEESADLSNKCEKLYANFLNDLIQNCKARADQCSTTEEMAMLRVLAEQVTSKFAAGEPQEDLQCRMLQGALSTMPFLSDKHHQGPRSPTFDDSLGIPSVSSAGLRANRDRIGGFRNR